jgi:hypothetical protein
MTVKYFMSTAPSTRSPTGLIIGSILVGVGVLIAGVILVGEKKWDSHNTAFKSDPNPAQASTPSPKPDLASYSRFTTIRLHILDGRNDSGYSQDCFHSNPDVGTAELRHTYVVADFQGPILVCEWAPKL